MKKFTLSAAILFTAAAFVSCSTDSESIDDTSPLTDGAKVTLFTGSNTSGKINVFDVTDITDLKNKSFQSASQDGNGLHYDPINDALWEASRSQNNLLLFENFSDVESGSALSPSLRSDVQIDNPRDIAVSGNHIVVSSDALEPRGSNQFYVYEATANAVKLVNIYETGNQHWGIFLAGNTLYAAVDNSNRIAVYNDFLDNSNGELTADDQIFIEGAQSLRGITYDAVEDQLFLADVRNPLNDSDGAIHTIKNFSVIYSGMESYGTIKSSDLNTLTGANTMLGNPVALEYDNIGKMLYVAERSTNGGMALSFDLNSTGNSSPKLQQSVSGISSIYLNVE